MKLRRSLAGTALLALVLAAPQTTIPRALAKGVVPCHEGTGDAAALAKAFRAGGEIHLAKECVYTVKAPAAARAALPRVTRDTGLDGAGSAIQWSGPRALLDIAPDANVTFTNVRLENTSGGAQIAVGQGGHLIIGGGSHFFGLNA
ncbi:hypothetical protein BTM25_05110 [Actinomadura rubteroloni]|uniref:Pectate lyase n=1 Tax=Actinomadura rubteroloni TaxID=1926885 RepID=A0A2P4UM46_9ACTN|nr:hypothetical protein [Actinomadura rubteroloni]POM26123.1 hypothetical protein BTM25_05110 [Actinomadura rubteroloni]